MSDDGDDDGGNGIRFLTRLGIAPGAQHLVLTFGIVAIAGLGYLAYYFGERIRVARGGKSDKEMVVTTWGGDPPIPIDVNGDGQEDIVGIYTADMVYIGAFDGRDGKLLWRFGPINVERPANGGLPQFGVQGDRVLLNQKGTGTLLSLRDGKEVGSIELASGRVVCGGPSYGGHLMVETSLAEELFDVDLAGPSAAKVEGRRPCERTMSRARTTDAKVLTGDGRVMWAISEGEDTVGVALEGKVATLHGYAKGEAAPKWSAKLEGLGADIENVDLASGRVLVRYQVMPAAAKGFATFDAKTGRQLWKHPLEGPGFIHGVSLSPTRAYVTVGEFLVVHDAPTGKPLIALATGKQEGED
jgi:outer membrane protein assembly factor BamB